MATDPPDAIIVTATRASGVGVRYAWLDFVECVYNDAKLPLGPFVRIIDQHQDRAAASSSNAAAPAAAAAAGSSGIPQSPPMGFNSWNFYHCNIDEDTVRAVIDAMVSNGMKDAGYEDVNIDKYWQVERFENGTIQPDPVRFPSGIGASGLCTFKGMKFGIYIKGSVTCQRRPGAYKHEKTTLVLLRLGPRLFEERRLRRRDVECRQHIVEAFAEGFQSATKRRDATSCDLLNIAKTQIRAASGSRTCKSWRTPSDVKPRGHPSCRTSTTTTRWLPWPSRVTLTILTCSK